MKVTVTDRAVSIAVEDRVYPYWAEGKDGRIVFFIRKDNCVIIKSGNCPYKEGDSVLTNTEESYTPLVNKTITIEV